MRRSGVVMAAALLAAASWSASAAPAQAPVTNRSFTILAEAFPAAPVPGRGSTELGSRPLGTRVAVSNAPASAYGRSAVADNGTIELYTGPPPEGTVAECDTTSTNLPRTATVNPGNAQLTADCTPAPGAVAVADGSFNDAAIGSSGSGSSRAEGSGGGATAVATSIAVVNDYAQGAMHIGSARYEASAETNGAPGGGRGSGRVEVSDATVGGVPVLIGPDGVEVDQSKVPTELVGASNAAVHETLGQGGYLNIRTAQPEVIVADDGTSVVVRGGGVFFEAQSNDPAQPYFIRQTLVGGSLLIVVGGDLTGTVVDGPPPDSSGLPVVAAPPLQSLTGAPAVVGVAPAPDPISELISQRTTQRTNPVGLAWLWIVIAAAALAGLAAAFRSRLAPWWHAFADRYVRG